MRAAGASTRRPRSPLARRVAIFSMAPALAAGLIALGAISPALAQDEPPVGPSATIGVLGAMREAARRAPAAAPSAAPSAAAPAEEEVTLLAATPAATATPSAAPVTPSAEVAAGPGAASGAAAPGAAASVPTAAETAPTVAEAPGLEPASAASGASAPPSTAVATPPPADAAVSAAAPAGGSRSFLINDGAPGSTASGWSPVAPGAPDAGAPGATGATAAAADAPAADEQSESPDAAPPGTTVIPSTAPSTAQEQVPLPAAGVVSPGSQVVNYEANQQMPLNEPQLHSLQEFMNEGVNTSPLGVELQEGARRGKNGREIDGLLVVALQPGSPAEAAGVQAGHRAAHDVLEGAAVAASLVFPPAVLAVPVIETIQLWRELRSDHRSRRQPGHQLHGFSGPVARRAAGRNRILEHPAQRQTSSGASDNAAAERGEIKSLGSGDSGVAQAGIGLYSRKTSYY